MDLKNSRLARLFLFAPTADWFSLEEVERKKRFLIGGVFCCFGLQLFAGAFLMWEIHPRKRATLYIPPPEVLPHVAFGYHEIFADSLWLRLIQDIDACGRETISRQEYNNTFVVENDGKAAGDQREFEDESVGINKGIFSNNKDERVCVRGWSYRLLDAITELAPRFRIAYSLGATTLSVLVNDHVGAKLIFDKGTDRFPSDWPILYRAAYHYLYEIRDLPKAAQLLRRAGDHGAPIWVKSLASRLYTREGQAMVGLALLKDYYRTLTDPDRKKIIEKRIEVLEASIRDAQNSKK